MIWFWFGLLLSVNASLPQVKQVIQVTQKPTVLGFSVDIENHATTPKRFFLSPYAQKVKGSVGQEFYVQAGEKIHLEYEIPWQHDQSYFITANERWIPQLETSTHLEQIFKVATKMTEGFLFIHSATGQPQDELDLVFCRCHQYQGADPRMNVVLLESDPRLAGEILRHLELYVAKFEADYGAYPYDQFYVVESTTEIGYAFPRMTWMGRDLLRLPFILRTSLPHELLHSWWGNGVFVDETVGNWCEGLTAFGADYGLLSEEDKKNYRLKAILSYMDFAKNNGEIPLSQFVSRGEDRSLQAIGYDKSLMVLQMLEDLVGPAQFKQGLREFYSSFRFKAASFEDLFSTVSRVSHLNLEAFKKYWLYQTGMLPKNFLQGRWNQTELSLVWEAVSSVLAVIPGALLNVNIKYGPSEDVESLRLKVRADGSGIDDGQVPVERRPAAFQVDPEFRLFRELDENERPVSFSQVLAAAKVFVRLDGTKSEIRKAIGDTLSHAQIVDAPSVINWAEAKVVLADLDQARIWPDLMSRLASRGVTFDNEAVQFQGARYQREENAFWFAVRVENSLLVVFSLGQKAVPSRWFQRWTRYAAKSYLVLGTSAAREQGLWHEAYWQPVH